MLQAIILGIIQGITEFLPISSTAHLVIVPWLFGWEGELINSLAFDVALHAGTLISVVYCFWGDIWSMLGKNRRLMGMIIIGTIPAGVAGVMLDDYISTTLRSPFVICVSLVVFGLVMYYAERFGGKKKVEGLGVLDSILIGLAQAIALIPGTSRSGITISAGLARGMKRHEAARFSFLLSLPVIAGATLLEGRKLFSSPVPVDYAVVGAGFAASVITGIVSIKLLIKYLQNHTLNVFVIYRVALAGVIAGWLLLGA